jgi:hypothetical protein
MICPPTLDQNQQGVHILIVMILQYALPAVIYTHVKR